MAATLLALLVLFGTLSLVSFGGGNATIGAMERAAVEHHHWLTANRFLDLFAVSRTAPGPGSLIAALVGQQAAGLAGAIVATVGMTAPSSLVVYLLSAWARRHPGSAFRHAAERALAPVAIGLTVGSALAVARHDEHDWVLGALTGATALVLALTELNPLVALLACGVVGAVFG